MGDFEKNGDNRFRAGTNQSLRDERERTDATFFQQTAEARRTDLLTTRHERAAADARLDAERARADEFGPESAATAETSGARRTEDAALASTREAADLRRAHEREELRETVVRLFASEREQTDARLLAERADVDSARALHLRYLGMLGHDLRGMLMTIELQATLLARQHLTEGDASKAFLAAQRIRRVSGRMERLVSDLVDTASAASGVLRIVRKTADLGRAVTEVAETFHPEAAAKGIALGTELRTGALVGMFDYDRILQLLGNFVGNALKFTPEGGRVTIGADRDGDALTAWVQDTGPGIPAEQSAAIFEPFQQLERDERAKGVGLGLYIARCVVEAHGGRIWVEQPPEGGSRFAFTIPIALAA